MNANPRSINQLITSLEKEFKGVMAQQKSNGTTCNQKGHSSAGKEPQTGVWQLVVWLLSSDLNTLLALPFIYGMIVPFLLLDVSVTIYQAVCFRLFNIPRVKKSDYIALERHHLGYLNAIEKINCDYCGYANGLIAFTREILSRTEQYFCPIKHANKILGTHERYAFFLKYGEADKYHEKLDALRQALADENTSQPLAPKEST